MCKCRNILRPSVGAEQEGKENTEMGCDMEEGDKKREGGSGTEEGRKGENGDCVLVFNGG